MMNNRRQQQDSLIKRYLSMIIQYDLQDENYGIVSIREVEVSPDGSRAWITVSTTSSTEDKMELVELLNENTGVIREELARMLRIRHTPALTFKADLSSESEEAVDRLLQDAEPVSEETMKTILAKEKNKFTIPEKRNSETTDLKNTNQKTPRKADTARMSVKSAKSSSNKLPL